VKLFHTDQGVARQEGDQLGLLDISEGDLDTVLANGTLADLHRAAVTRVVPISDVTWLPPVLRPGRFVIAGLNYRAHCEEIGRPIPEKLVFGFAPGAAAHAADSPVIMPAEANTQVDYEGEIGIVIGRTANNVSADAAWSVVAGITTLNDVSARDVQAAGTLEAVGQAKGFPTFKPFGPCLATVDEFDDPTDLDIRTWVNGELRQQGRSGDMVFPVPEIIAIVSRTTTLEPGDVVCTGTPGGVAHGGAHPYLQDGDVVEIEVDGLLRLKNTFISETAP
jgi:2-keto-4-pentenoate hydratase/2-oxohepta-3-ene-1,7-dioic acid hydratase in catechol pathway